jgi:hypothetical protein
MVWLLRSAMILQGSGAQVLIHGDRARTGADARGFQVQLPDPSRPADREEHGVGHRLAGGRAAAVIDADGFLLPAERGDKRARGHGHPPVLEGPAEFGRNVGVGGGHEDGAALE